MQNVFTLDRFRSQDVPELEHAGDECRTPGCLHCRHPIDPADAVFISGYAHPGRCAQKVRERQEPLPWLERAAGRAGVVAVVTLIGMVICAAAFGG